MSTLRARRRGWFLYLRGGNAHSRVSKIARIIVIREVSPREQPRTDPESLPRISRAPSHSRQDTHESAMQGWDGVARGTCDRGKLSELR